MLQRPNTCIFFLIITTNSILKSAKLWQTEGKIPHQSPAWETNYLKQTSPPQTIITALPSRNLKWEKRQPFMCLNLMFKQPAVICTLFLLSVDSQNASSPFVQNVTVCQHKAVWRWSTGITQTTQRRKREILPLALHPWETRASGLSIKLLYY